jgi:hypothetical protein
VRYDSLGLRGVWSTAFEREALGTELIAGCLGLEDAMTVEKERGRAGNELNDGHEWRGWVEVRENKRSLEAGTAPAARAWH